MNIERFYGKFKIIKSGSIISLIRLSSIKIMLTAFTAALLLITISELGDKTFFIAVILSSKYNRKVVFAGVVAALATMTVISVAVGQIFSFLPQIYIHYAEIILFALFGVKLLYDASKMPKELGTNDEQVEAVEAVEKADSKFAKGKTKWKILLESFILTFVAEWGDRTQIATIALATFHNPIGVIMGGIVSHYYLCGYCGLRREINSRKIIGTDDYYYWGLFVFGV